MQIVYNGTDIGPIFINDLDNAIVIVPPTPNLGSITVTDRSKQVVTMSYGNTYDIQDTDEVVRSYIDGHIRDLINNGNATVTIPPLDATYIPTTPSDWQLVPPDNIFTALDQAAQIASSYRNGTATLLKLLDGSNIGDVTHHIGTAFINSVDSSNQILFKIAGNNKMIIDPTLTSILTNTVISGTISASNITGVNTGDQTITLTGGVTGSGTGTFAATVVTNANLTGDVTSIGNATTIGPNKVTLANLTTMATNSLLGRSTAGTGNVEVISVGSGLLLSSGVLTATGAGSVSTVSVVTANGISGSVANPTTTPAITLTLGAITPVSIAATGSITGNNLTGTNTGDQVISLTGDVTGSGTGTFAATISANAVTLAKMAQVPTQTLLGRSTAGAGNVETINIGAGLNLSGGTLTSTGAGTVTSVSVVTANGVSGSVANPTSAPAITLTLGAITPSSVAASGTVTGSNISGTNTGDQTITLTGGVTGSGTGTFAATVVTNANLTGDVTSVGNATTIGANKITLPMMAQIATNSLLGRSTAGTGNVEVLSVGSGLSLSGGILSATGGGSVTTVSVVTANGVSGSVADPTTTPAITLTLGAITPSSVAASGTVSGSNLSGTNTGDQTIALFGDVSGSGTGSFSTTIANDAITTSKILNSNVTFAKIQSIATNRLLGRSTAGSGSIEELSVGSGLTLSGGILSAPGSAITLTGDVTGTGTGSIATTIGPNKVTLAMTTMDTGFLLGRTTAGTGSAEQITVGIGLTLIGGDLSVTAGAGGVYDSGSFTLTWHGFTTTPTSTCYWARAGNIVTMRVMGAGGVSNANTLTVSGFPGALIPSGLNSMVIKAGAYDDNGAASTFTTSAILVGQTTFSGGSAPFLGRNIVFSKNANFAIAGETSWTASGNKGMQEFTFSYILL